MTAAKTPTTSAHELPLATRSGWQIPNQWTPELRPFQLRAALTMLAQAYPDLVLRSITATYNCVGMAFAARRVYIDDVHIDRILEDDDYALLESAALAKEGDIVVYRDDNGSPKHVGIVIEPSKIAKTPQDKPEDRIVVLSKWGEGGEYFHRIKYVSSAYGTRYEIWTDRKEL